MKKSHKKIGALLTTLCLCVTTGLSAGCKKPAKVDPIDDNYRVFYQIFVGSFSDSDGDGTGDLRGIINRMDYLNDGNINSDKSLGVQGIWLSPIFDSPSYHKYDARDYYKIDPQFGTEEDLQDLLEICHKRNVKVILDLAINHTAKTNSWFTQFVDARKKGKTDSEYYNYYTCVNSASQISGHTYYPLYTGAAEYYEGNFSSDMPELNYDNAAVKTKMVDVAKHYLDLGVDGFRFDAIKYVYYNDTQKSAEFWKWYKDELVKINPDVYTVGECWSSDGEILEYYPAMNCFSFDSSQTSGTIASAAKNGQIDMFARYVENFQKSAKAANENAMYIPFIANHDTDRAAGYLPLEQVDDDGTTLKPAYMAANIYLLCTGSPFIYYGEEIGMKGTRGAANTDANRRLAMLWGDGDTVKNPVGSTYKDSLQINGTVKSQTKDDNSLMNHYKNVILFRNRYPQIARGNYTAVCPTDGCAGFIIEYNGEKSLLLHNVTGSAVTVNVNDLLAVSDIAEYIGQGKAKLKGNTLTLDGQTSVLLK